MRQENIGRRPKPKLLDQVRNTCRVRHLSLQTEKAYVHWIRRFVVYHGKRHPRELEAEHVRQFLTFLATELNVASSTQNQALCAIVLLYRYVVRKDIGDFSSFERARRPKRLPVVLTRDEVAQVLANIAGTDKLIAQLLYGAGLRLSEALRLRVRDVDIQSGQITVRSGKGDVDRITVLPDTVKITLEVHLKHLQALHRKDTAEGFGETALPNALSRKYPGAARSWRWQYVFPSVILSIDRRSGRICRHHRSPATVFNERSKQPYARVASQKEQDAIRSGTVSRHTLSRQATTFGPSKSCWDTRTSKPPWCTHT
jgi:integron integrase